ncbi:MAG TPA: FHA domain-containing protein [Polyangiaceae bacterium]|nr:FHA domain-containing protein [Polyangiaceae bacterium]
MNPPTREGEAKPEARVELPAATRWRLLWRSSTFELPASGSVVVGRSPSCDIVIHQSSVSRTHCRISLSAEGLVVQDLRSSNGLYVNGDRETGRRRLASGDRLLLGSEELVVSSSGPVGAQESGLSPIPPGTAPSVAQHFPAESPSAWNRGAPHSERSVVTTQKADAFETLGKLADRMLASGRFEAASRILSGHMRAALRGASAGERIPAEVIDGSIHYALALAEACHDGSWIDYVLELSIALRSPPPVQRIDQLRVLLDRGVRCDPKLLAECKAVVRTALLSGSPIEKGTVEALLALVLR